ncbi:B12-binding domain-containing radical SAM protein [Magnetococcus sp. PR-3]|uniref:B12-binding domain-containing radical SAM protein n=1 Tax=Magnetococcus sp. PR-3 TaxID=3120355 RepID=UPI002FCE37DD
MANSIDVLLIHPGDRKQVYQDLGNNLSAVEPPILAALFAGFLKKKGLSVAIYDIPARMESAQQAVTTLTELYSPTLVVIPVYGFQPSASTQTMSAARAVAQRLKESQPNLPIMMTGPHPAALPHRTLQEEPIDYVCSGEGPLTILETLQALKSGQSPAGVGSLWYRDDEGEVCPPSKQAPLMQPLGQEMMEPAWDLLEMSRYRAHNWHCFDDLQNRQPYVSLYTTLGCPFKCNFCCINAPFGQPSYRMWPAEQVVKQIDHLVQTYQIRNIKFADEMFVLNKRHVTEICDLLIERDYDLNIWAYARVDTAYPELLDKMRQAGFRWLALGIESASDFVRDGAEKSLNSHDIMDVVKRIQSSGIYVLGNYIFGLPDETLPSMHQTLNMAKELNCEFANFYSAMAYPGSELYRNAVDQGLDLPEQWHHYSQHAYDTKPLANDQLSAAEILGFRDYAFDAYFTDPNYLNMVGQTFGSDIRHAMQEMVKIKLKRRLLDETPMPEGWPNLG